MANTAQARKRARQALDRRTHNVALRSRFRTYIKNTLKALGAGDAEAAEAAYKAVVPVIDSTANKGLIHKNKAARYKSRLNTRVKALKLGQASA